MSCFLQTKLSYKKPLATHFVNISNQFFAEETWKIRQKNSIKQRNLDVCNVLCEIGYKVRFCIFFPTVCISLCIFFFVFYADHKADQRTQREEKIFFFKKIKRLKQNAKTSDSFGNRFVD